MVNVLSCCRPGFPAMNCTFKLCANTLFTVFYHSNKKRNQDRLLRHTAGGCAHPRHARVTTQKWLTWRTDYKLLYCLLTLRGVPASSISLEEHPRGVAALFPVQTM